MTPVAVSRTLILGSSVFVWALGAGSFLSATKALSSPGGADMFLVKIAP